MSNYSNNNIDGMAVGLLTAYVNSCQFLEAKFNYNDKELLWDGDIKVFSSPMVHSRETFTDRIPVQIKGHEVSRYKSKEKCKYSIPLINLQKYKIDNGVLYFEIELKSNTNYRFFYKCLLPSNIDRYLQSANQQETITVNFEGLDYTNKQLIKSVCDFFLEQRSRQMGKSILDISTLKEVHELTIDAFSTTHIPDMFDENAFFYTQINGELHPVYVSEQTKFRTQVPHKVSIGEKVYFDSFILERQSNITIYKLGHCVDIVFKESKRKKNLTVRFNINNITFQQLQDEKNFVIDFFKNPNNLAFGDTNILIINEITDDFSSFCHKILGIVDELFLYSNILNSIGCKLDLQISSITESQIKVLLNLNQILQGNVKSNELGFKLLKIANGHALVFMYQEDGFQKCVSAFDEIIYKQFSFTSNIPETGHVPISPYFTIKDVKQIVTAMNFEPNALIQSVLLLDVHESLSSYVILYLLELLRTYDEVKDERVLDVCEAFYKNNSIYQSSKVMLINKYQIVLRKRSLTECEKNEIIEAKANNSDDLQFVCCANLLLGNIAEFEYTYKKLDDNTQVEFAKYPIIRFYNGNLDVIGNS